MRKYFKMSPLLVRLRRRQPAAPAVAAAHRAREIGGNFDREQHPAGREARLEGP